MQSGPRAGHKQPVCATLEPSQWPQTHLGFCATAGKQYRCPARCKVQTSLQLTHLLVCAADSGRSGVVPALAAGHASAKRLLRTDGTAWSTAVAIEVHSGGNGYQTHGRCSTGAQAVAERPRHRTQPVSASWTEPQQCTDALSCSNMPAIFTPSTTSGLHASLNSAGNIIAGWGSRSGGEGSLEFRPLGLYSLELYRRQKETTEKGQESNKLCAGGCYPACFCCLILGAHPLATTFR